MSLSAETSLSHTTIKLGEVKEEVLNLHKIIAKSGKDYYLEEITKEVYRLCNGSINKENIVDVAVQGMIYLKKRHLLGGNQKKALLVEALKTIVLNLKLQQAETDFLVATCENVIPNVIDSLAWVSRQKIGFKPTFWQRHACCAKRERD